MKDESSPQPVLKETELRPVREQIQYYADSPDDYTIIIKAIISQKIAF